MAALLTVYTVNSAFCDCENVTTRTEPISVERETPKHCAPMSDDWSLGVKHGNCANTTLSFCFPGPQAFRLSDNFMKFMAKKKRTSALTAENVAQFKINHTNILEEIPVKLHNSELSKALLCELARGDNGTSSFEKLDLSVNPYLEKHVESLQDELDDMIGQMETLHDYLKEAQLNKQKRMKFLQERRAINKDRKKSGLELLVRGIVVVVVVVSMHAIETLVTVRILGMTVAPVTALM